MARKFSFWQSRKQQTRKLQRSVLARRRRSFVSRGTMLSLESLEDRRLLAGGNLDTTFNPAGAIPVVPLSPAPRMAGDQLTFHSRPDLTPAAVEVTRQPGQRPTIVFHGRAAEFAAQLNANRVALSLSHTKDQAIAHVILES